MEPTIQKVSVIISQGSLEGIYPGLFLANGARAEGIDANVFFTFFGLEAIRRDHNNRIKIASVGNPGLHLPTWLGAVPGVSALMTKYMNRKMAALDIPPIPEFVQMIADTGAGIYACKVASDMFGLTHEDFVPCVKDIITVGEFYDVAAGGEIIYT